MPVDNQERKRSTDVKAWETVSDSLRNGTFELKKLDPPQLRSKTSLTSSCDEKNIKEEGRATSLPGSTAELDLVSWPTDDDSQCEVRVTILPAVPAVKDDARKSSRYSTQHQNRSQLVPRPDNHLCLAITGMICCCFPLGVVGFICAMQVDKAYDDGNREGAAWRSRNAKYLSLTAVVFGMLGIVGASFYLIFYHLVPLLS